MSENEVVKRRRGRPPKKKNEAEPREAGRDYGTTFGLDDTIGQATDDSLDDLRSDPVFSRAWKRNYFED